MTSALLLLALVVPGSAGAAKTIGVAQLPTSTVGTPTTMIQTVSPGDQYEMPSDGVLTSWSFLSSNVAQINLKVARPVGGPYYLIVGEGTQVTQPAGILASYPVRVPVEAGDLLGLRAEETAKPYINSGAGYVAPSMFPSEGTPGTIVEAVGGSSNQASISAILEPDADNDGFGDETQDGCPTDGSAQGACPADSSPPETQITKRPKDKTKKKKATFEFSSSEPGSSFQCSLDGAPFAACTSPVTEKVGNGSHTFQVRATDSAGNVDPSEATDGWKVRKKK